MHLVLFFSRNTSLFAWDEVGMLDREVALYQILQRKGLQVSFVTNGNSKDLEYQGRIPGIRIVCNQWKLPEHLYHRSLAWVDRSLWRGHVTIKSNQVKGSEAARRVAERFGKPFIARCGYLHSNFAERQFGLDSPQAQRARDLEQRTFSAADRIVVTTERIRDKVIRRYSLPSDRVEVIPNYVDTILFSPGNGRSDIRNRICFVGRLIEQKNLTALLDAVKGLDVELLIVGNDAMRDQLERKVATEKLPVRFLGNVPNRQLPALLNTASLFILPSLYEGHPKALIEAMSCGLPVIGADVPGINDLIQHGVTGWLCGTSPAELRRAICQVLHDDDLRLRLGRQARTFALEHFSLDRIAALEYDLIKTLSDYR